jgi:hypothetical protein
MNTSDKLNQYEILIRQFEFRMNKDDFNYLICISKDVLNAFITTKEINDRAEVLANGLLGIEPFSGTDKKDKGTLQVFDDYKCFLLAEIKTAKAILGREEMAEV